jgi:ABC-type multidrug transport system fused ATPase/permease subunit
MRQLRLILVAEDYRQFGWLFVFMLVAAVMQVVGIASILPFMQLVTQPDVIAENKWLAFVYERGGFDSEREMLLWTGVVVFVLFALSVIATALTGWLINRSIWATLHRMSVRLLTNYTRMPYEFFLSTSSTDLLRRTLADLSKLLNDVLLAGSLLLANAIIAIGLFMLLVLVNPLLSAVAFLGFGFAYVSLHLVRHSYLTRLGRIRIETDGRRYNAFIETILGMKAIRVANASRHFIDRFVEASDQFSRLFTKLEIATKFPRYIMEILAFGGILIVVLVFLAIDRDFEETLPLLSVFALATYRLMPALHTIFENAAKLSHSYAVIEAVAEDMRTDRVLEPEIDATSERLEFSHDIRFNDTAFRYQATEADVVRGVELVIEKGRSVALVGATGSGKTTLADILVGLLQPTHGALEVDGVPISADKLASWRELIAYVPQDVFLSDTTIASNIAFGGAASELDETRMREAARWAELDAFIEGELKDGYDSFVGERGIRLSGGQRQRLGIARAVYRKPEVLLLDEATSALDTITEKAIMSNLRMALPGVTIVMIAHRLSTVRQCDLIYVLDKGRVVAQGSYEDLCRSNPLFRKMVEATQIGANATDSEESVC